MDAGTHGDRIKANDAIGITKQVNGTASFIIEGQKHSAAFSFDELARSIDGAIAAREAASRPIPSAPAPTP
jgi:protein-disulfide isomerase